MSPTLISENQKRLLLMNGRLITFNDIQHQQEIDLIGGCIEVSIQGAIYRGKLDDILWWNQYPRRLDWKESTEWNTKINKWMYNDMSGGSKGFPYDSIEKFSGPFELDTSEIFFAFERTVIVTLFPRRCEPPHLPCGHVGYQQLCRCFQ